MQLHPLQRETRPLAASVFYRAFSALLRQRRSGERRTLYTSEPDAGSDRRHGGA